MYKINKSRFIATVTLILVLNTHAAPATKKSTTTMVNTPQSSNVPPTTSSMADATIIINNLKWTPRSVWQAAPARHITPINNAYNNAGGVPYVIIHHTVNPGACHTAHTCQSVVRSMQRSHQEDRGWDDIGYNFLIGGGGSAVAAAGDAEIYEGRGFNVGGAHAPGYNARSLGIALIGDWSDALPSHSMLDKVKQLINYGIQKGFIQKNYTLLGHRQVKATECPGAKLFNEIKHWPHFEEHITKS